MNQQSLTKRRRQNNSSEESYAGPAQIDPQPPTPPQTPQRKRQRRTQGSSEEAILDGEILRQDYRTGGPRLCRLPVTMEFISDDSPTGTIWRNGLSKTIHDILDSLKITYIEIALQYRRWIYDRESVPTEIETIMVHAVKEAMDEKWYTACLEIRLACSDAGLGPLNVEIADSRGLQPTLTHPIYPHEPFAVKWNEMRPGVIALLAPQEWISLSLLRRGTSELAGECPVTIVVTIPEDSESLWSSIRDNIANMLDREGWYEVAVEIGRGSIWRGASPNDNRCLLETERDWKRAAQMGRSAGRRDTLENSGTLGGFIEILSSDTGKWEKHGLTCFHCVLPSGKPTPNIMALQNHGIRGGAHSIEMDQPSRGDHQETLRYHQVTIDNIRTEEHKSIARQLNDPDDLLPHIARRFKKDQHIIQICEMQIEVGEEFFRHNQQHLGTVFAGSGLCRADNGYTLDWALIDVKQERVSQNKLLSLEEVNKGKLGDDVVKFRLYNSMENKVVGAQVLVGPGDDLFKFGRTTDFTWGRQNGVKECRLLGWRKDEDGGLRAETHDDYQVVGMPVGRAQMFGERGDSGAFVLNGDGGFVGLLFGGNENTNSCYYTAADDLFASIRSVTGAAEVRLPDLELNNTDAFLKAQIVRH